MSTSVRIRTDGEHSYREDTIVKATGFYGRNKTESLLAPLTTFPELVRAITCALECEDLTHTQRRELAEQLSTRHFDFQFCFEDDEIVASVHME